MAVELSSRPLLAIERDLRLFVGRDSELAQLERSATGRFNTLVVGERGAGKTSLLRALLWRHRNPGDSEPVFVYLRPPAGGATSAAGVVAAVLKLLAPEASPRPEVGGVLEQLAAAAEAKEGRYVVLVDDIDPEIGLQLFGGLRDEVWEIPLTWFVTATVAGERVLRTPPADAFFEMTVTLGPLPADEAHRLVDLRVGHELAEATVNSITAEGGLPRDLVSAARSAHAYGVSPGDGFTMEQQRITDRLSALGRPAAALYAEIADGPAVSASDQDLQTRMGWSRSRLLQVFAELVDAKLVDVVDDAAQGPGRPKKLYRTRFTSADSTRDGLTRQGGGAA